MLMLINDEVDDVDAWVNPGANGAKPNHSEKIGLSQPIGNNWQVVLLL